MIFIVVKFAIRPDVATSGSRVSPLSLQQHAQSRATSSLNGREASKGPTSSCCSKPSGTAKPARRSKFGALQGGHGLDARHGRGNAGDYPRRSTRKKLVDDGRTATSHRPVKGRSPCSNWS